MSNVVTKLGAGSKRSVSRSRRHSRVRKKVTGTAERPRLVVFRSSRHISAQDALDLGLIGYGVPDGEALAKAIEIGQEICSNGPLAVKAILRTLRETNGMRQDEALEHEFTYGWDVFGSNDAKEGPRAFKEKRTPNFTGT